MARPLVVYFKDVHYLNHPRRVYIAATTQKRASEISGKPTNHFSKDFCKHCAAGAPEAPTFIEAEGCWVEIRDHDKEGHLENDAFYYGSKRDEFYKAPTDPNGFIRCDTLAACMESLTLLVDRALAARGIPREEL